MNNQKVVNKKVAVIIITWKGMKWIKKCLQSIRNSDYPATVFIIDNNSLDKTPDFIEKEFPEVILTRSNKNLGFGKANNIAIRQALDAGYDFFFLLNQDAYIESNTISELIHVAENGEYGIISPIHMNGNASHVDFYFRDHVLGHCAEYLDSTILPNNSITIFESTSIPAAAWFLPKKTILDIGGFEPLFYHYGEDDNYCSRVQYHKRSIVFTLKSRILHDREDTVGNKKVYNKELNYRHLLLNSMDINQSAKYIIQKIGRQFYDDLGLCIMYLLTGQWRMLHNFLWDYYRLLSKICIIKKNRKENKKLQANWI